MAPPTELSRIDDNLIKVSGRLDVSSVAHYKEAGIRLIDGAGAPVLDLSDAEVIGSAVIALLIAWQRHALRRGKPIEFTNPPDNLLDIARACGVDDILTFTRAISA